MPSLRGASQASGDRFDEATALLIPCSVPVAGMPNSARWIVVLLMLAGCADPSEDPPLQSTQQADETISPLVNATQPPPVRDPVTVTCDVVRTQLGTPLGVGLYADRVVLEDPGCYLDELFGPAMQDTGSVLIEITWTPQASMTGADAWVEADDCQSTPLEPCELPYGTASASPLVLRLEGDDVARHKDANLGVQVAAQGVAVQQAFTVHLTSFAQVQVPDGFSAV